MEGPVKEENPSTSRSPDVDRLIDLNEPRDEEDEESERSGDPSVDDGGGGGGDDDDDDHVISLREFLDKPDRGVEVVESLHIFRQVVDMVRDAHGEGVVVGNVRPSCFVMSTFNRVAFIESASCSGTDSCEDDRGSEEKGSCSDDDDDEEEEEDDNGGERKGVFPLKQVLAMEANWYTSPEETGGNTGMFESDIYRLGVLLFELFCVFGSAEERLMSMANLRHRVLPPHLLLKWPKVASFCLWMLHPLPSNRPKMMDIQCSELLNEQQDSFEDREVAIKLREDIENQDLVLDFLMQLKNRKQEFAVKLHHTISCLSADIDKVAEQRMLLLNPGCLPTLDKDDYLEVEKLPAYFHLERIDDAEPAGSRKRYRHRVQTMKEEQTNTHSTAGPHTDNQPKNQESILNKSSRLLKNLKLLESTYFQMRKRMSTTGANIQNKILPANGVQGGSLSRSEGSSVNNSVLMEDLEVGRGVCLNPFLDGLKKYLSFSRLKVRAEFKQTDLLNSSNLVCSLGFDRDKEMFATAGVNKKIKIFECNVLLNEDRDIHYPVVEMASRSRLSSICWNGYVKQQIASSDFEGVVQVWDVARNQVFAEMREHGRRVWCVDFSVADPTKLASGSDDATVKIWNINQPASVATIQTKAFVCSVQFPPGSGHSVAVGSADHRIYCYDLRNLRIPLCTLVGHSKTISYVKFLDSSTLISASTDNSLKLWDLSMNTAGVVDNPIQTFTGHTNVKNFVGLSISDGYIATGSETNEVFIYHKAFPMPMLSFGFRDSDFSSVREPEGASQFISCVCWRGNSSILVAANSSGSIKLLEMV